MGIDAIKPQRRRSLKSKESLTVRSAAFNLRALWAQAPGFEIMIDQSHSYRRYYYYGPLSDGRDGRAMGRRGMIT